MKHILIKYIIFSCIFFAFGIIIGYTYRVFKKNISNDEINLSVITPRRASKWVRIYKTDIFDYSIFDTQKAHNETLDWEHELKKLKTNISSKKRDINLLIFFAKWIEKDPDAALVKFKEIEEEGFENKKLLYSHWASTNPKTFITHLENNPEEIYLPFHVQEYEGQSDYAPYVGILVFELAKKDPQNTWNWLQQLKRESLYEAMISFFDSVYEWSPDVFHRYANIIPLKKHEIYSDGDSELYSYLNLQKKVRSMLLKIDREKAILWMNNRNYSKEDIVTVLARHDLETSSTMNQKQENNHEK